ncbi:MAG TPA: DUF5665 domain-containing protein [bacterium]|nr:DUF5665 domain-containing protein [bacterium]
MSEDIESEFHKNLKELHSVLLDMKKYQEKQSSLKWNFWRGIAYGLGFFIGSALLTTILVYILRSIGGEGPIGQIAQFFTDLFQQAQN